MKFLTYLLPGVAAGAFVLSDAGMEYWWLACVAGLLSLVICSPIVGFAWLKYAEKKGD